MLFNFDFSTLLRYTISADKFDNLHFPCLDYYRQDRGLFRELCHIKSNFNRTGITAAFTIMLKKSIDQRSYLL